MASLVANDSLDDDVNDDDEVLGVCEKKSFISARGRRMVLSTIQQREQLQRRGGHFKNFADAAKSQRSSGETKKNNNNNKDLKYACFYCFKKFHSLDLLQKHAAKELHDEKHDVCCTNCRKVCKTYFRLREHLVGATASEACKEAFEEKGGCRKCLRIPEDAGGVHVCAFGSSTGSSRSVRKKEGVCDECAPHVAIDCEMIATTKSDETLAKVCVVNGLDESVLMETVVTFCSKNGEEEGKEDEKVKVLDYRTEITGLTASDFETKLLPTLAEAREEVLACLAGAHKNTPEMWKNKPHKLVVHDARHDLRALQITDEDVPNLFDRIRDTSTYVPLQKEKGKRVKLKKLVEQFLEADDADADNTLRNFQSPNAPHSPHLDALAALRLYRGCRDNCFHFQAVQKGPLLRRKASSTTPSTTTPGGGEEEKIEYFKTPVLLENEEEKNEKDTWLCCCWCEDFASANT
jgi:hypothetical protein